jgi:hypothetical protein
MRTEEKGKIAFPRKGFILGLIFTVLFGLYSVYGASWGAGTFYGRRPQGEPFGNFWMLTLILPTFTLLLPLFERIGLRLQSSDIGIAAVMMAISWGTKEIPGYAWTGIIYPTYAWPVAIEKGWIPEFWYVSATTARNWVEGRGPIPWGEWFSVLPWWIIMMIVMQLPMIFWATWFRRDWIEIKRLPFPIAQPITELTKLPSEKAPRRLPSILSEKMFLYGIIIGILVYVQNSIHMLVPTIPVWYPFANFMVHYKYYTGRAWIDLAPMTRLGIGLRLDPAEWALYYILPSYLLLTNLVWAIIALIIIPAIGFSAGIFPDLPAPNWVTVVYSGLHMDFPGAKLAIVTMGVALGAFVWILWQSRGFIAHSLKASKAEEAEEALPYKVSIVAFFCSWILVLAVWMTAGADLYYSILGLIPFFAYEATMYLRVAEGWGATCINTEHLFTPVQNAIQNATLKATSPRVALPTLSLQEWISAPRLTEMQHSMHWWVPISFSVGKGAGVHPRHILLAIFIAMTLGFTTHCVFRVWWGHSGMGLGAPMEGMYPVHTNEGIASAYSKTSTGSITGRSVFNLAEHAPHLIVGLIVGAFMVFARARFAWFPFHWAGIIPLQYFPGSFVSLIVAYIVKTAALRVGGTELYRKGFHLAIGFLTGFGLEQMLEGVIALSIGLRNIPYP